MTKKDYELIASCLNSGISYIEKVAYNTITHRFATELSSKNPHFNKEKFLKACGIEVAPFFKVVRDDKWYCKECKYKCFWNNYKDGTPICPNCDIDLIHLK